MSNNYLGSSSLLRIVIGSLILYAHWKDETGAQFVAELVDGDELGAAEYLVSLN